MDGTAIILTPIAGRCANCLTHGSLTHEEHFETEHPHRVSCNACGETCIGDPETSTLVLWNIIDLNERKPAEPLAFFMQPPGLA